MLFHPAKVQFDFVLDFYSAYYDVEIYNFLGPMEPNF